MVGPMVGQCDDATSTSPTQAYSKQTGFSALTKSRLGEPSSAQRTVVA